MGKQLFMWAVEWWPVCHSNNISRLLSPAVMRGAASSALAKVRSVWSAVYVAGLPSVPGCPSLNSVTHTGHHTAPAQYSLHSSQPTTAGMLGMFCAPFQTGADRQRAATLMFHTYLQFSCSYCSPHSFLVFASSLLSNPLLWINYFLNNGVM